MLHTVTSQERPLDFQAILFPRRPTQAKSTPKTWENRLKSAAPARLHPVTASLLAARDAYQDPATGQRMKSGAKLGDAYYERSLLVAKRRLFEAGVRLAWVLNEVFPVE